HAELTRWLVEGVDLERGVLLVARTGYSRLDEAAVCGELDRLAAEIRPGLPSGPLERLRWLAKALHEVHGFHGNQRDYYDPENSYINRVLARRTGLPISLSV